MLQREFADLVGSLFNVYHKINAQITYGYYNQIWRHTLWCVLHEVLYDIAHFGFPDTIYTRACVHNTEHIWVSKITLIKLSHPAKQMT